ncbi:MAG: TlpA family protein disulfide reductase [Acidobacteria bacterium]|nr:TlpA family protein disulfide reductase [Acidobacteriota bacterium]
MRRTLPLALLAVVAVAVTHSPAGPAPASANPRSPIGSWRAAVVSPGGDIPFGLVVEKGVGPLSAYVVNGDEKVLFTSVNISGAKLTLRFDHYDSQIVAEISADGASMTGTWTKQAGKDRPVMPFTARRVSTPARFDPRGAASGAASVSDVSGSWDAVFVDDDGKSPATAELKLTGERLLGTFLTPTGDYRYLEGDYGAGVLRLSCFDGGHAFLFVAKARGDGTLAGDFWSRGAYHATWTASRSKPSISLLPDSFAMTALKNPTGRLSFAFPDLDGKRVSLADARFKGKVVLVDVFGSWCPNCNDQAPVLEELYARYHARGLEIVGLAYEMTGEAARDAVFVRKYAERHHVSYPLLLAGTSDKAEASATLPDLSGVLAFPTLVFVGREGEVKAIHTGFAGPGTGAHFTELKAQYVKRIEELLGS